MTGRLFSDFLSFSSDVLFIRLYFISLWKKRQTLFLRRKQAFVWCCKCLRTFQLDNCLTLLNIEWNLLSFFTPSTIRKILHNDPFIMIERITRSLPSSLLLQTLLLCSFAIRTLPWTLLINKYLHYVSRRDVVNTWINYLSNRYSEL